MINIGKIKLKNPVMTASGTFGSGEEINEFFDINELGAIVTKTITPEKRTGNPTPRVVETASGMLNSIGLEGDGIDGFIKKKGPFLKKLKTKVIVSIAADNVDGFKEMSKKLSAQKFVSAIEINLSCPNVSHGVKSKKYKLAAQDPKATETIVKEIRKTTKKTIITKLTPNVTDITEIAKAAEAAGSDAIAAINTLVGMSVDINTRKPLLGNIIGGLSGPAIKPVALKMVWDIYKSVKIPIIGIGGIMNAKDAIEFILCGATAVQIGTATFVDPMSSLNVVKGINEYLKQHKIKNIKQLRGAINI